MKKNLKNKLALSYAEALYEAAAGAAEQDALLADMQKLAAALRQDGEIVKYLSNPLWKTADKKAALADVAAALKLSKICLNCLDIMADNNRLAELPRVAEDFARVYYRRRNIAEVEVVSAVELQRQQQDRLTAALQNLLAQKIVINYVIKPEVLGGLLIQCGSKMIDDTIAGKLKRLELLMKGKK